MRERWSPLKAALVVFAVVVALGLVSAVVLASADGVIHNQPFTRGQLIGTGAGTLGIIAGAIAYLIQSRRV
jgi:hypothetical protein